MDDLLIPSEAQVRLAELHREVAHRQRARLAISAAVVTSPVMAGPATAVRAARSVVPSWWRAPAAALLARRPGRRPAAVCCA